MRSEDGPNFEPLNDATGRVGFRIRFEYQVDGVGKSSGIVRHVVAMYLLGHVGEGEVR